eukprot:6296241-Amphidinium_carterae.1
MMLPSFAGGLNMPALSDAMVSEVADSLTTAPALSSVGYEHDDVDVKTAAAMMATSLVSDWATVSPLAVRRQPYAVTRGLGRTADEELASLVKDVLIEGADSMVDPLVTALRLAPEYES